MAEKSLACPFINMKLGEPIKFKVLEPIVKASQMKAGRTEANDEVTVMDFADLSGPFKLTVPAIMKGELERHYPGGKYVGKCFELTRYAKTGGGKASPVRLKEIDAPKVA